MTDKPTGVFVRLPLSEEQIMKLYNPKQSGNENLLAIGTPVTDMELEVYHAPTVMTTGGPKCIPLVRQSDALAKLAEKDAEIAEEQRISNLQADAVERWTNTCAQQDEVIDRLRAEIMRLNEELSGYRAGMSELIAKEIAALKGGAA